MRILIAAMVLTASSALAHMKITSPDGGIQEWVVTDSFGDPQKTGPCGTTGGTKTNFVKTVTAGSKLKLNWLETIGHPGHYRISLASSRSMFVDPVVSGANCGSAAIQSPPVAPVLMDGLFPHANGAMGMSYEQEITIPNTPCTGCTIQVLQFMSAHAPPCMYYHCIDVNIVPAGTGGGAGGGAGGGSGGAGGSGGGTAGGTGGSGGGSATDGGTGGGSGGGSAAGGGAGGGSATGGGSASGGGSATGGGSGTGGGSATGGGQGGMGLGVGGGGQTGGCSCDATGGAMGALLFGTAALLRRRRNS